MFANDNPGGPPPSKFDFMGMCIRESIQRLAIHGALRVVYLAPDVFCNLIVELGSNTPSEAPKECRNCGAPFEHTAECKYCGYDLPATLRMWTVSGFTKILPDRELIPHYGTAKFARGHEASVKFY